MHPQSNHSGSYMARNAHDRAFPGPAAADTYEALKACSITHGRAPGGSRPGRRRPLKARQVGATGQIGQGRTWTMISRPTAKVCQSTSTPPSFSPERNTPTIKSPKSVPKAAPRPPNSDVPPITTAVMAYRFPSWMAVLLLGGISSFQALFRGAFRALTTRPHFSPGRVCSPREAGEGATWGEMRAGGTGRSVPCDFTPVECLCQYLNDIDFLLAGAMRSAMMALTKCRRLWLSRATGTSDLSAILVKSGNEERERRHSV